MQATTLLSVASSAVVVAALSSSLTQLQPAAVLVSAAASATAAPAAGQAVPAGGAALQGAPLPVAAPSRPAYVEVAEALPTLSLRATGHRQGQAVDVLACTRAWSPAGECPGQQTAVLRDAALSAAARVVPLPVGAGHVRVSVGRGEVTVMTTALSRSRP